MIPALAVIGGTGLIELDDLKNCRQVPVSTPYGSPSAPLVYGELLGKELIFLARHGQQHTLAPHKINYRANLWALQQSGAQEIIAVAAVGGIHPSLTPQRLAIPDQLIDYTHSRTNTFFEDDLAEVVHIDFTQPYCGTLRQKLIRAAREAGLDAVESGTYAAMEGPRLETAAEIDRLERDGCDMVGMTGMPEAALARELGLCYATCAVCANPAAGRAENAATALTMDAIRATLARGMEQVNTLLKHIVYMTG